jgi:hypothetical protein
MTGLIESCCRMIDVSDADTKIFREILGGACNLRTQMTNRKVATALHYRRGRAYAYPAIRDGWPAGRS